MAANLIDSDPRVMMGKPVIRGTRIPVESILDRIAAGETIDDIVASHDRLTREGVQAALLFAADAMRHEIVHPTSDEAA